MSAESYPREFSRRGAGFPVFKTRFLYAGLAGLLAASALCAQPSLTQIYSFAAAEAYPYATVAIGPGGVLYGTTYGGNVPGTVYSLTPPASPGGAWTPNVLYMVPVNVGLNGGVTVGSGGILYGTTDAGGTGTLCGNTNGCGTVFSLTPPASPGGAWTPEILYSFTGAADGSEPNTPLTIGSGGTLYGTTYNPGTVFSLAPPISPSGMWTYNLLYAFGSNDGVSSGVVIGSDGVLYGTNDRDGIGPTCQGGCGTVFSLTPPSAPGGVWTENIIHYFIGGSTDGAFPYAPSLAMGHGPLGHPVLYGTAFYGGHFNAGVVYSLTPPSSPGGQWTETIIHSFVGNIKYGDGDGSYPEAGVVIGHDGILYGTTSQGGLDKRNKGTVFALQPPTTPGGAWTENILCNFIRSQGGQDPYGGVVIGAGGMLYGTTVMGGASNSGTVFSLMP